MAQIAPQLAALYEDYYATDRDDVKRALTAKDTLSHIKLLSNGSLGSVLDVGAGEGATLLELDRAGIATDLSALEISPSGADKIKHRGLRSLREVRQFDGYAIPYPDKSFDTAICIHVVEHVEHERLFLRELGRVAKTVFVEVPLEGGFRGRVIDAHGHINYYTPMIFLNLLKTSGLKPVSHRIFASSREYEQLIYGRRKGAIKNAIRKSVLRVFPESAPHLMTYLLTVKCT